MNVVKGVMFIDFIGNDPKVVSACDSGEGFKPAFGQYHAGWVVGRIPVNRYCALIDE